LLQAGLLANLIVSGICVAFQVPDIRDVPDITDLIAKVFQPAEYQVKGYSRAGMAQVRITIYGRAANIQTNMWRVVRLEKFFLPRKAVLDI
jgi:hypothetical protein